MNGRTILGALYTDYKLTRTFDLFMEMTLDLSIGVYILFISQFKVTAIIESSSAVYLAYLVFPFNCAVNSYSLLFLHNKNPLDALNINYKKLFDDKVLHKQLIAKFKMMI